MVDHVEPVAEKIIAEPAAVAISQPAPVALRTDDCAGPFSDRSDLATSDAPLVDDVGAVVGGRLVEKYRRRPAKILGAVPPARQLRERDYRLAPLLPCFCRLGIGPVADRPLSGSPGQRHDSCHSLADR